MRDTVVIDLDGTLSDCSARRHLVEGKHRDYEAFHARIGEDKPVEPITAIMREMFVSYRVLIVSARPQSANEATRGWLNLHGIYCWDEVILLRPDGDSTPDQELKRAWLQAYGKDRILFVVDDRQKVVDMWRAEGVTCLQCAAWTESKTAAPARRGE
jgi:hypothetical protein